MIRKEQMIWQARFVLAKPAFLTSNGRSAGARTVMEEVTETIRRPASLEAPEALEGGYMSKSVVFLSLCFVILASQIALSQTVTGSIVGAVADPNGAVIQGASVRLVSESTKAVRETKTDHEGNFTFNALVPDTYTVTVEQPGFKKFERTRVALLPNDHLSVGQVALELGTMAESVRVSAEGAMVQTASSERSGVVTSEQVQNLTILSRDFSVLASLQPGVVYNGAAETQSFSQSARYNVNGGRPTANHHNQDGH